MKKLTKIVATTCLAGVCALSLAGCSSDITFNQSNLDALVSKATEYLTDQNEYSVEFSKSYFINKVIDAQYEYQNGSNAFLLKMEGSYKDFYGNTESQGVGEIASYYDEDTKTNYSSFQMNDEDGIYNQNGFMKTSYNRTTGKYSYTYYNLDTEKYKSEENVDLNNTPLGGNGFISSIASMDTIFTALTELVTEDDVSVIMDKINDKEVSFKIFLHTESSNFTYNVKFNGNKVVLYELLQSTWYSNYNACVETRTFSISYNITKDYFNFDVSNFTEDVE